MTVTCARSVQFIVSFVLPSKRGGLPELLFLLRRILLPQLFGQ